MLLDWGSNGNHKCVGIIEKESESGIYAYQRITWSLNRTEMPEGVQLYTKSRCAADPNNRTITPPPNIPLPKKLFADSTVALWDEGICLFA